MANEIEGVLFDAHQGYAICHVIDFSDDLKELMRKHLSSICHGSHILDYGETRLFSYEATIESFLDRYDTKPRNTQIGMVGEFLSHILITELFDDFDIVTAFFNPEEKSIKKGFDLILYQPNKEAVWITEVKSGNIHQDKTLDQTTSDLLYAARADLDKRLNESESMFWYNAVNSVRSALTSEKDYKKVLLNILIGEGDAAVDRQARSDDNNVVLVSNLFEPLATRITRNPALEFHDKLSKEKKFAEIILLCVQKGTYAKVIDFLRSELADEEA